MKKKLSILLAIIMLFSGCNTAEKAEQTTAEITTTATAEMTVTTTTTTTVTTTAVTTESVAETTADGSAMVSAIAPKLTDKKITVTAEKLVDYEKIRELYGYDFEIEKGELYDIGKEYCEKNYGGEELEDWKSRNYLDMGIEAEYLKCETADWLVNISYWHPGFQFAYYENFVFIKDGEIAYETGVINTCLTGNCKGDRNDRYYATSGYTILHINMLNGEYDFIDIEEDWPSIADINEDYFIFGNGLLYIYDRINKEIIVPEVDINWCGLDGNIVRLNGSRIEYSTYDDPETVLFYDIKTGESGKCDYTYYDGMFHYFENDEYTVKSPLNVADGEKYNGTLLTVTRKSDGLSKNFDMTKLPEKEESWTNRYTFQPGYVFFIGDWFIPNIDIMEPVAINFETEEAVYVDYQIDCHAYMLENSDGRYFGRYLNENEEWEAGEVIFELP